MENNFHPTSRGSRSEKGCATVSAKPTTEGLSLNGVAYQTLYDGSQDFEGETNDVVLAAFFKDFEGEKAPTDQFTKIIAINEEELKDYLLGDRVVHTGDQFAFVAHEWNEISTAVYLSGKIDR